jgi:threonine/homoserine/homoserine lactone efflux protein
MSPGTHYLSGLLLIYGAVTLGLMSPGPNILSVIGASMSVGRSAGVALALGVAAGSFLWAAFAAMGLTALLAAYASLLVAVKIAGGLYLLWLGLKAFRGALSSGESVLALAARREAPLRYFPRGLAVQMTNPKAAFSWIAITALGIEPGAPGWTLAAIILGTGFLSLLGHLGYALAFSTRRVVHLYRRARRWIEFALGTFFCCAGAMLLTSRS